MDDFAIKLTEECNTGFTRLLINNHLEIHPDIIRKIYENGFHDGVEFYMEHTKDKLGKIINHE